MRQLGLGLGLGLGGKSADLLPPAEGKTVIFANELRFGAGTNTFSSKGFKSNTKYKCFKCYMRVT
jgi:hypothetical protein